MLLYLVFWFAVLLLAIPRSRPLQALSIIIIFLFIGFRYETGFDWPFYKNMHLNLSLDYYLNDWMYNYNLYGVESGYLFLVGNIAPFVSFEYFQAFVAAVFIYSTLMLARAVGHNNPPLALAVCLTYLLLTLLFSTIRQCLAISLFNIGLAIYIQNYFSPKIKIWLVVVIFALATSFQNSTFIYCVIFVYCNINLSQTAKRFLVLILVSLMVPVLLYPETVNGLIESRAAAKIQYYSEVNSSLFNSVNAYYLVLLSFIFFGLLYSYPKDQISRSDSLEKLISFARILVVVNIISIPSAIVRDRISYELFIVASILFTHQLARLKLIYSSGLIALGVFWSSFATLYQYTEIVFVPYQNYIIYYLLDIPSDGSRRQAQFFEQFDQRLKSYQ